MTLRQQWTAIALLCALSAVVPACSSSDGDVVRSQEPASDDSDQIALPEEEQEHAAQPLSVDEAPIESLEDFVAGATGGIVVAGIEEEGSGRSGSDLGEGFAQLRNLSLRVERSFAGGIEAGETATLEVFGTFTTAEGETYDDTPAGCVRLEPGQRVLVGLVPDEEGRFGASCNGVFILEAGEVVDTGRTPDFIREAEAGSEADLLAAIEALSTS